LQGENSTHQVRRESEGENSGLSRGGFSGVKRAIPSVKQMGLFDFRPPAFQVWVRMF
jgi:hypothetical protein